MNRTEQLKKACLLAGKFKEWAQIVRAVKGMNDTNKGGTRWDIEAK